MFTEFIKSLERPGNETLIEAILEGYISIFENNTNITYQEGGDALGREYHGWIAAFDKTTGERIGYVDYSYYQGKTAVKMIEVFPEFQHKGYGMMLLNKLQERSKNPITIQGNYATKEGAALFKKFKKSRKSDGGLNEAAETDDALLAEARKYPILLHNL